METLTGKVAVVTGASRGVGAAVARESAAQGWTVIVHGGQEARVAALVEELRRQGHAESIVLDCMVENAAADLIGQAAARFGRLDAVVALPGGCGTWEELFEALSWKRLGLYTGPVVIVNTRNYYAPMLEVLERSIEHHFMDQRHRAMWSVVEEPEQVLDAIHSAAPWSREYRSFAAL